MPLLPIGSLRIRDATHSTMTLDWDAAPGAVRKYIITYRPEDGDAKEVRTHLFICLLFQRRAHPTSGPRRM